MKIRIQYALMGLALGLFLLGAETLAANEASAGQTAKTRAIVVQLFEAFNRHDLEAMVALYHPDVLTITPDQPQGQQGLAVIRETYARLFEDLPGGQETVHRIVAEGNQAAVEFTAVWEMTTENGETVRLQLPIASFVEIRDGKIILDKTYYDRSMFAEPAGGN